MSAQTNIVKKDLGHFCGAVHPDFDTPAMTAWLGDLSGKLKNVVTERLSYGPDYVVKLTLPVEVGGQVVALKIFKRQGLFKDWYDQRHGSKAERSFVAARYLQSNGIGTPAPIAWLDKWVDGRLLESYYLCLFDAAPCLRDLLSEILHDRRDNAPLLELMQLVAPAVRAMHDAGFKHGDMGNQNILLPKREDGTWGQPQFIDLNRGKISSSGLSAAERAFDISRMILPGAYLKIFKLIYSHHEDISVELDKCEQKYRVRYERHRASRKFRRPLRYLRNKKNSSPRPVYPSLKDIWLWDEKSAQPMIALDAREKRQQRQLGYLLRMFVRAIGLLPLIYRHYRKLLVGSYQQPIKMQGRIGVAIHPHPDYIETELSLLESLGNPPVLIRFCHHETPADWQRGIEVVNYLHRRGVAITAAVLQDRRAVTNPGDWSSFLELVVTAIADKVEQIEITHAMNRVKWGVWSDREFATLLEPAFALQSRYPQVKWIGPACIDFEYMPLLTALAAVPKGAKFSALSHLLYVDRRGAPENKQGYFSTLEKSALLRAVAETSDHTENQVIISEVNWPLKDTDEWSPVTCPYVTPKWRRLRPGETEEEYANYLVRFYIITLCSGHVDQVFWWRLSAFGYGLVDDLHEFRQRPAFVALKMLLGTLGEAVFVRKWPTQNSLYLFEFERGGKIIRMAWVHGESTARLPEFAFDQVMDRDGNVTDHWALSESPLYFI